MTSTHECGRWTCPHCFTVISWSNPDAVRAHMCDGIREQIAANKPKTAKLDSMIKVLKPSKRK